jgi:hypothetical protein
MHSGQARESGIDLGIRPRIQHIELYSKLSRCILCFKHLGSCQIWEIKPTTDVALGSIGAEAPFAWRSRGPAWPLHQ